MLFSRQRLYEIIQKIGFSIVLDLVPVKKSSHFLIVIKNQLADFVKFISYSSLFPKGQIMSECIL